MAKKKKRGYYIFRAILGPVVRFFTKSRAEGVENIPKEGGFILCSNHIGLRDVIILSALCPRQIRFVAKAELFGVPLLRGIIKLFGAVKLDRGGGDVAALKTSVRLLNEGEVVSIFPQGHRFPGVDPAETPIKNGVGLVAYRAEATVLPAHIIVKKYKYSLFRRVKVVFGKPIPFSSLGFTNGGGEEYKNATRLIFDNLTSLGTDRLLSSPETDEGKSE